MPKDQATDPAPSEDPKPPQPAKPRAPVLGDDNGIPARLTTVAIGMGLALIMIGVGIMAFATPRIFNAGSLAMCIGFGLVLAAFGTRAAGTWQTWSVAGSGGIAIVLFLLLQALPSPQSDQPTFVRGNLHGTDNLTSVRMFAAQFMLVGRSSARDHFRFVAFPDDLEAKSFYIYLVNDNDTSIKEGYIGCISTDLIKSKMKSRQLINLSVEKDDTNKLYRLRDALDGAEYGEFGTPNCRGPGSGRPKAARAPDATPRLTADVSGWIGSVFASEALAGKMPKPKTPSVAELIKALESESSDVRVSARDDLGDYTDPASLAIMTSTWDIEKSSYRGDLGRLVAWTNAIRDDREIAPLVAAALSPQQVAYLVQLTGHPDKTMRYNATEVLSWMLQSTGATKQPPSEKAGIIVREVMNVFSGPDALKISKPGTNFDFPNLAFNTLVALDDAKCVLKPDARQSIATALAPFETKYGKDLAKTASLSRDVRAVLAKPGC